MKFTDVFKIKDLPELNKRLKFNKDVHTGYLKEFKDCTEDELNETFTFYDYFNRVFFDSFLDKNNTMNLIINRNNDSEVREKLLSVLGKEDLLVFINNIKKGLNFEYESKDLNLENSFDVLFTAEHGNMYSSYFDSFNVPEYLSMFLRIVKDKELSNILSEVNIEDILLKVYEDYNLDNSDYLLQIINEVEMIVLNKNISPVFIKNWIESTRDVIENRLDVEAGGELKEKIAYIISAVDTIDYIYFKNNDILNSVKELDENIKKLKKTVSKETFLIANELLLELQDFAILHNLNDEQKCKWMKKETSDNDVLIELPYPALLIKDKYVLKEQRKYSKNSGKIITALEDMVHYMGDYFKDNLKFVELSSEERIVILVKPFLEDDLESQKKCLKDLIEKIFEKRDIVKMVEKLNKDKETFLPSLEEALQEVLVNKKEKTNKKNIRKF